MPRKNTKTTKKQIKPKSKEKSKPDMSWWKDHCKWLDTFRGKIVSSDGRY